MGLSGAVNHFRSRNERLNLASFITPQNPEAMFSCSTNVRMQCYIATRDMLSDVYSTRAHLITALIYLMYLIMSLNAINVCIVLTYVRIMYVYAYVCTYI